MAPLAPETVDRLLTEGKQRTLTSGEVLFKPGDRGDSAFIIAKGRIEIFTLDATRRVRLALLNAGQTFGEQALREPDGLRTAGALAVQDTTLIEISGDTFRNEVLADLDVCEAVDEVGARQSLDRAVRSLSVLQDLPAHQLTDALTETHIPAGTWVMREGSPGDAAFFLIEGVAIASRQTEHGREVLGRLGPGQCIGELALLRRQPRAADVRAETDLRLLRVDAATFLRWHDAHGPLRTLLGAAEQLYAQPAGELVTVHRGKLDDEPAVSAVRSTPDGRRLVATSTESGRLVFTAGSNALQCDALKWHQAPQGLERTMYVDDNVVVGLVAAGGGPEIADLCRRVTIGARVTDLQRARFAWAGRLGPMRGLVGKVACPCLGLSSQDVRRLNGKGVCTIDELAAQTGATTVCARCVPTIERLLKGPGLVDQTASERVHITLGQVDEVIEEEAFDARLNELRSTAPGAAEGFFGPDSVTWRLTREVSVLLAGGYAALLQLAHPAVARGVVDHSVVTHDAHGRFQRTIISTDGLVFHDLDRASELARRVHLTHHGVSGHFPHDVGSYRAGDAYEGNDPSALLWVAATLVHATLRWHEMVHQPLSPADATAYHQEVIRYIGLFGLPAERIPRDPESFRRYVDGMLHSEELTVSDEARELAHHLLTPPRAEASPAFAAAQALTAGLLPPRLREAFDLPWRKRDRLMYETIVRSARQAVPHMPESIRFRKPYLDAMHRLGGEEPTMFAGLSMDVMTWLITPRKWW